MSDDTTKIVKEASTKEAVKKVVKKKAALCGKCGKSKGGRYRVLQGMRVCSTCYWDMLADI